MMIGLFLLVTFQSIVPAVRSDPLDKPMIVRVIAFVLVELLLALLILTFWALITLLAIISRRNKPFYCERTLTLCDEVFVTDSQYGKSETCWPVVQKLARTRTHIFMYLSQESAVIVPRHAFESLAKMDAFYDFCRQRTDRAA